MERITQECFGGDVAEEGGRGTLIWNSFVKKLVLDRKHERKGNKSQNSSIQSQSKPIAFNGHHQSPMIIVRELPFVFFMDTL